jgi:hypothetical protein
VADAVVWIGGPTGAGKTTVARRLAQRWGLRLYSADNWTWVHRDRAIAAGVEAAIRFESLTPEARAAAPLADRRAMWLRDERAAMAVDDVRRLPSSPLVVAEGDVIAPHLVDPARAVWLDPSVDFQVRHRSRDWVILGGATADTARECGIATVAVDGTRTVSAIVDEVERAIADVLRAGPHAASLVERRVLLREANVTAITQIRDGCARPWATADPESQVRSFVCECGRADCAADVEATVATADATPVLAPGH